MRATHGGPAGPVQPRQGPGFGLLGDTQLLANGNVFAGWGPQPTFSEYTKSGKLLLDATSPGLTSSSGHGGDLDRVFPLPASGAAPPCARGHDRLCQLERATQVIVVEGPAGTSKKNMTVGGR